MANKKKDERSNNDLHNIHIKPQIEKHLPPNPTSLPK
jgi:hypothetical protein